MRATNRGEGQEEPSDPGNNRVPKSLAGLVVSTLKLPSSEDAPEALSSSKDCRVYVISFGNP